MGTKAHYQLGDLGLVPRPNHYIQTSVDRTRELTATTRLGGLKKVLTRSVAIQTVSTPKVRQHAARGRAMFFLFNDPLVSLAALERIAKQHVRKTIEGLRETIYILNC